MLSTINQLDLPQSYESKLNKINFFHVFHITSLLKDKSFLSLSSKCFSPIYAYILYFFLLTHPNNRTGILYFLVRLGIIV